MTGDGSAPARRVVSLNCSNTEIVHALGCADRLVGVDADSDWPEAVVRDLPRVGRDLEIDIAAVAALEPDLVLASLTVPGHEAVVAGLEAASLPHYAPETITLADVYADIEWIATQLGVPARGAALTASMRAAMPQVPAPEHASDGPSSKPASEHRSAPTDRRPKVLVEWWPKPVIAPGRQSWVHEILELAGATNPLGDRDVKSTPLTDAEVTALNPDAIAISWCGVKPEKYRPEVVTQNPAWHSVRAVQNNQVVCIPECFLGRPGPRLVEGYRALTHLTRTICSG